MHRASLGHNRAVVGSTVAHSGTRNTMRVPCSVLLIEGDAGHAQLAQRALSEGESRFDVDWVTCLSDATARLASRRFDVLLCELTLPDSTGIDTITAIRKLQSYTPLVVLTSLACEQTALAALDHGAQDYVTKDAWQADIGNPKVLEQAIRYAIHRHAAVHRIQKAYRQARRNQRLLKERNKHLARLYNVAQQVVENVSHEFRTPLTVIKEYASLIRDGVFGEVTVEQGHFLDVIADRSQDLNRMVDDMLDVSKLDAGLLTVRRNEHDLADIIRHVMQHLKRKAALKGVTLIVELERHLPRVYCDADKAGRTIDNLVVNAITVCQKPGLVRLSARFAQHAHEVVIEVTDDGPGIREGDLQRIFTRFTQIDMTMRDGSKGFGLGLSIAKELVDMNLGRITATSRVGAGSCFAFTLPCTDPVEIARRFLAREAIAGSTDSSMASLGVVSSEEADAEVSRDIEPLLQYVLRANDLVFRVRPQQWIVLMSAHAKAFETFRDRLAEVLKETNLNRFGVLPLPPLASTLVGTWDVHEHLEMVLAKVRELAHPNAGTPA